MSQAKFDKAVAIIQGLPKDGPIKPSQDDQLYVSLKISGVMLFWLRAYLS